MKVARPTTRRPRRSCWIWVGQQEGSFVPYCDLPLYIFSGEHLLCARLRCSNNGAAGSVEVERIVGRIRQSWPEVSTGPTRACCRDDLLRWCEDHHGLRDNDRLKSESAEAMTQAEAEFNAQPAGVQGFPLPDSPAPAHDASRQGRVPGEAISPIPDSSSPPCRRRLKLARALYEDFYCARGDMENRIKEQQLDLDRTSAATMRANQLRLYLSSAAYMLMHALRRLGEADPPGSTQCQTIGSS